GGGVDSYVRGGNAYVENDGSAAANNNIVTVNAGNIGDEIRGGSARVEGDGSSAANGNTVTVNAGSVYDVYGGYAEVGDGSAAVNNNTVSIIGGSYVDSYYNYINGGFAFVINGAAAAANNSVIIDNSRVESNVYGGYANVDGDGSAAAAYNTVSITNSYVSCVYGGHAYVDGDGPAVAANNTLIIADSYVDGEVLGGYAYAGDSAIAINNTVTVIGNTVFGYSLYGGYTNGAGAGDAFTGNTLNLRSGSIRAGNGGVGNFQYYNFVFPVTQTVPVLTSGGAVVLGDGNGTGSTVTGVNTTGSSAPLKAGVSITLIQAVTLDDTDFTQTQTQGQHGIGLRYKWALEADTANNKLIATVLGIDANPQTKILSEGAAAGAILARQGAENINGALLNGLQEGKIEAIASVFGGSSKYDTGSSVEMSIFGAALGAAKKFASFDAGAFIEYASGSFDTEHKGLKGDGETTAIGIGIVAKKDVKEDVYIEGLIRAGQVSNDYKSKIVDTMGTVFNTDFDYSAMYFGISLGGGRIFKVNEKVNVDAFAKYALTSTGGGDADLSSGNKYEFDSILSNRIKAGAKGEYKINDKFTPYLALSYDYELSGDINAKIDGYEVEEPSLNGGTFSGGLGVNAKAAEKLTLDLSINGYSGVREGVIGSLQVKYEF
ncbi:MAG: autotransporter outer membrane beta-barrel domain-containing protein, partial [Endomicrobia bacterium]|nr:autotransporter outer membrane beta-barrel domain-containing protein [Endomicrobiia bacterium]